MKKRLIVATILMTVLIVGTMFVMAFGTVAPETSGGIALRPLQRRWDDLMVAGVSGGFLSDRKRDYAPTRSWETAEGSPILGSATTEGISIVELRGTRWLGLFRGAGWTLSGGLLGRIHVGAEQLELYGKQTVRWSGGVLGLDTYHGQEDESYEFFLLHRTGPNTRARILKRWEIAPNNVAWFPRRPNPQSAADERTRRANMRSDVRGYLEYDPSMITAIIKITGLQQPFEERVDVSHDVGGTASPR